MKQAPLGSRRLTRAAGATAGALAIALIAGPAVVAQDDEGTPPGPPTITMKAAGKNLSFDGPATVVKGQELRIVNGTNPSKIGPHSFSLAKASVLPDTPKEFKQCFSPGKVCMDIAIAHKFNPRTEKVAKPIVNAGAKGWNKMFSKTQTGDSWYTEKQGQAFTRRVTARAGATLSFICAVHPDMQGKIKVVAPE